MAKQEAQDDAAKLDAILNRRAIRPCKVGRSERLELIEAKLAAGASYQALSAALLEAFGERISDDSLMRHKTKVCTCVR